jgi:hypothetical protein
MLKKQPRNSYTLILASIFAISPAITFAQVKTLKTVIDTIVYYLNSVLVLLIGVAVVIFVWHVIKYFIMPNEDRKNAGLYVMYSLIGFFVLLSFWGLVNILQNTFNLKNENNQPYSWTSFKGLFPGGGSSSQRTTTSGNLFTDPCPNGSASGPNCQ